MRHRARAPDAKSSKDAIDGIEATIDGPALKARVRRCSLRRRGKRRSREACGHLARRSEEQRETGPGGKVAREVA